MVIIILEKRRLDEMKYIEDLARDNDGIIELTELKKKMGCESPSRQSQLMDELKQRESEGVIVIRKGRRMGNAKVIIHIKYVKQLPACEKKSWKKKFMQKIRKDADSLMRDLGLMSDE